MARLNASAHHGRHEHRRPGVSPCWDAGQDPTIPATPTGTTGYYGHQQFTVGTGATICAGDHTTKPPKRFPALIQQ